jgi:hypothetical protein
MAPRNTPIPDFGQYRSRRSGTATPTGAFVKPTADRNLQGLIEGLGALNPSIQRFSAQLTQQTAQEKQAEGIEAARALVEQGLTLAEATRTGKLPQQDNPWFMAGFHEKMGQSAADSWHWQLIEDMKKNPELQESTSVQDAQDFINKHREEWMGKNAPKGREQKFFSQGFGLRSDALTRDEMTKFANGLEGRLTKKSTDMHFSQVKQHVEKEYVKGTSPEEIAEGINILVQTQYSLGSREKDIDQNTIHAVVAAAMEMGDERPMAVLKRVFGSKSGAELGDTLAGTEAMDKARLDIRNRKWNQEQRDWQMKERADKERLDSVLSDAMMAKLKDPNFDLKTYAPRLKDNPEGLQKLAMMENTMNVLNNRTNEQVRSELFTKIFVFNTPDDQTTETDVAVARAQNLLTTEDAAALIGQIRQARDSGKDKEAGIWGDFQFRQVLNSIDPQFRGRLGEYENDKSAQSASFAQAMFMERWLIANQSGGVPVEKRAQWLTDVSQEVINIAKGPADIVIKERPVPQFQSMKDIEARLPTTLVLDPASLAAKARGTTTTEMQKALDNLGLRTPSEQGAFLKSQLRIYIKQFGKPPPALNAGTAPKEE